MDSRNFEYIFTAVVGQQTSNSQNVAFPATSGNQLSYVDNCFVEFSKKIANRQLLDLTIITDEERKLFASK
jgi:hypothetical protein